MKKINLKVVSLLLCGTLMFTSCIGSYSLFNKYENWQCHMTGNKYINGIVGFVIQGIVAPVCLTVDCLVLNTIEFWSGSNPLAENTQYVKGEDGRYYAVKTTKTGYEIKSPSGEVTYLIHDAKADSWTMKQQGVVKEIFRFNADGTIRATLNDGQTITVTNDQAGLDQIREAVKGNGVLYANR